MKKNVLQKTDARDRIAINHREIFPRRAGCPFLPPPLLPPPSPFQNCILYDVSSTRNCSLSRMSCLLVGCYDRRVGESICIYRGNSAPHRPGLSYIDQHSSLITMLQLQINKVLIGPCCIYRLSVFVCSLYLRSAGSTLLCRFATRNAIVLHNDEECCKLAVKCIS